MVGDWQHPYTTMDYQAEAGIFRELAKFLLSGELYRGKKSVMWSVVEKTALAEAEVEYHDHTSTTIIVRFPVVQASHPALAGASVLIWTTTPWTMPGNRAVAYGEEIDYRVIEVTEVAEGALARVGEKLLLAATLVDQVAGRSRDQRLAHGRRADRARRLPGRSPAIRCTARATTSRCRCWRRASSTPSRAPGSSTSRPRTAPTTSSSVRAHGLEVPDTVAEDGVYTDQVPLFAGVHVFKAAEPVIAALLESGALLARGRLTHSYPHSWRSKAPLDLPRDAAVVHPDGRARAAAREGAGGDRGDPLGAGVRQEPDPRHDREPARLVRLAPARLGRADRGVRAPGDRRGAARRRRWSSASRAAFERDGADAWFTTDPAEFLGPERDPADYEQVIDIVDVWFESGSTHATVLEQRAELALAGLALPRGLGPASRLVPLLAARELRHARPGALRARC